MPRYVLHRRSLRPPRTLWSYESPKKRFIGSITTLTYPQIIINQLMILQHSHIRDFNPLCVSFLFWFRYECFDALFSLTISVLRAQKIIKMYWRNFKLCDSSNSISSARLFLISFSLSLKRLYLFLNSKVGWRKRETFDDMCVVVMFMPYEYTRRRRVLNN